MNLTALLRAFQAGPAEDRIALMAELGRLIAWRIRAIEMWDQSPDFFGYPEVARWSDEFPTNPAAHALQYASAAPTIDFLGEDLVPALVPGGTLYGAIERGDEVTGYVVAMIGNFLINRQRHHDPVGSKVFKNLEGVIEELAEEGEVVVTGRQGPRARIRRASTITFRAPATGRAATAIVELVLAAPSVHGAVHRLAKCGKGARRLLRPAVAALPAVGVAGFVFGELLIPLQARVREAVRLWEGPSPNTVQPRDEDAEKNSLRNRMASLPDGYGTLDEYLRAVGPRILAAIDAVDLQKRTRVNLKRVLQDWFAYLAETGGDEDEHPPLDDWARRLGVPRSTLWDHFERLRALARPVLDRS